MCNQKHYVWLVDVHPVDDNGIPMEPTMAFIASHSAEEITYEDILRNVPSIRGTAGVAGVVTGPIMAVQ